jgi:hypothetical protein
MTNLVDAMGFTLSSSESFEDRDFAQSVIQLLLDAPLPLRPTMFGAFSADLRVQDLDPIVDVFTSEATRHSSQRAGSLLLANDLGCRFQVQWNKPSTTSFPFVSGYLLQRRYERLPGVLSDYVHLIKRLAVATSACYGQLVPMNSPGWDTPFDLRVRLPDIPAACVYGPEYVTLFGSAKIESAPFVHIEKLGDCRYWLEAVAPLTSPVPAETRRAIRQHLGEDAFMADGRWRYKSGVAPAFATA